MSGTRGEPPTFLAPLADGWTVDLGRSSGPPGYGSGLWVHRRIAGGWLLTLHLLPRGSAVAIDRLELQAAEVAGVTGDIKIATGFTVGGEPNWEPLRLLRELRSARAAIDGVFRRSPDDQVRTIALLMGFTPGSFQPPRRGRRPGDGARRRTELAIIAAAYADAATRSSKPHSDPDLVPRMLKAVRLDGAEYGIVLAPDTLRHRVLHARREGFLTAAERIGRAGGTLTDAARQVLADAHFTAPWYPPAAEAPGEAPAAATTTLDADTRREEGNRHG